MSLKGHRISVAGNGNIMRKEVLTLVEEHLFERLARERNITVEKDSMRWRYTGTG